MENKITKKIREVFNNLKNLKKKNKLGQVIRYIGVLLFVGSLVIPFTAAPITCPLIWKVMIL